MAKSPKPNPRGRIAVAVLTGTVSAPVSVEVNITDPEYTVDAFADDVKFERVWALGDADAQGWKKLVYSADGPTGDPWQIGKIRFSFDAGSIEQFGKLSGLTVKRADS